MCVFQKKILASAISSSTHSKRKILLTVPCGHCVECKKRRANEWNFRLQEEAKMWHNVAFVTLTYNDKNLPIYCDGRVQIGRQYNGLSTLHISDLQKFFKRLRHQSEIISHKDLYSGNYVRFKYFATGEYGYNGTIRPHYHFLLFYDGLAPERLANVIRKVWDKGRITCTRATTGRFCYISNYVASIGVLSTPRFRPPCMVCSLRSPIGYNWLYSDLADITFKRNKSTIPVSFINRNGERIKFDLPLPRFYSRHMGLEKSWEELVDINTKQFIQQLRCPGVSTTPVLIGNEVFYFETSYYAKCEREYNKLVNQHKYREYEQHIKFDFQTWLTSFHQFVLRDLNERRLVSLIRHCLQQTSDAALLVALLTLSPVTQSSLTLSPSFVSPLCPPLLSAKWTPRQYGSPYLCASLMANFKNSSRDIIRTLPEVVTF